ncbi:hypothetical protein Q5752_001249 [Cryptotrichosporon argae]
MLPVSATVRAAFVGMLAMSAASARPAARGNHGSCASDSGAHSLSASSSASVSVSVSSSNAAASSSVAASASPDTGELVAVALKSATSARSATATHWRWSASSAAGSSATVKSATIKSTTTKSTTTKSTTTEATTTKSATAKSTTAKSATSKSATVKSASSVASATTATSASSATVASSATTSSASASSAISSSAGSSATASSSSSLSASTSASAPAASGTYYQPALDTLILVDLETTTLAVPAVGEDGLTISAGIYDIDYSVTADEIASYHDQGLKVICYFPGGVWEAGLSDALSFDPACYCGANVTTDASGTCTGTGAEANKLADWDNWWFDIRANGSCLASVEALMQARIEAAAAKGCDGIDVDDMDAYENGSIFDITEDDEVSYLLWFAETAHANGLAIALKNAGGLLVDDNGDATTYQSELVAAFDLNVIESCHEYDECDIYDSMLAAGKPQIQMEYSNSITSCPALAAGQALAVYAGTDVFSSQISLWCS